MKSRINFGFTPRVPMIFQSEAAECGLASLAMIAGRYGPQLCLRDLRVQFPVFQRGVRLPELIECAEKLQMLARPVRVELDELKSLRLPCILHWGLNHFVVLTNVSSTKIKIHDPALGRRTLQFDEVGNYFTGIAVEIVPALNFQPKTNSEALPISTLMGKISGWKRSMALVLSMGLTLEIFGLAAPMFNQWVVDEVISSSNLELLNLLVIASALLILTQVAIGVSRSWSIIFVSTSFSIQWMTNVFSHLLRLPLSWFEKRQLGDIVSRVGSVHTIQKALTVGVLEASIDGIFSVLTLSIMLTYSWKLSGIVVIAVSCYGLIRLASYRPLKAASEEALMLQAKEHSFFLESVRGIQAIKLFGKESDRRSRWLSLLADATNRDLRTERYTTALGLLSTTVGTVQGLLLFWLGANLVIRGEMTIGALFAFGAYSGSFSSRSVALLNHMCEFRLLSLHSSRLGDIVLEEPERRPVRSGGAVAGRPNIEFSDVSFRYNNKSPWLLRHASFSIEPGEFIVFAGGSGCGKTTIIKLLLGVLRPIEGEVLFGGVPVHQLSHSDFTSAFGSVMQNDQLFCGSIADNICFFDENYDQSRIVECAKIASIHADIEAFPMGYQTSIGDMGDTLSGGQRQRVMLARALYKSPSVLVLDEATSHLDTRREQQVNKFISDLAITRVVVSHRPETIAMADRVIEVLEDGNIRVTKYVDDGCYRSLNQVDIQ